MLPTEQKINYQSVETSWLIERFVNDIMYDVHSTRAKIERSKSADELKRRGKIVFTEIVKKMQELMKGLMKEMEPSSVQAEVLEALSYLAYCISVQENLLEIPYDGTEIPFSKHDYSTWVAYLGKV